MSAPAPTSMDRATRLRMQYAQMMLRAYNRRIEDLPAVLGGLTEKLDDPRRAQEETLRSILTRNADCEYGKRHGFAGLDGYADFRAGLPVVQYEDLRPSVDRMLEGEKDVLVRGAPSYFSTTSGSVAAPKFIPGTQQSIVAGCDAILARNALLKRDHPGAFAGRPLFVVGSVTEGRTAAGVSFGAMTGFGYYAGQIGFPGTPFPYGVFTLQDYATRYRCILRLALAERRLGALISYNPSTLVLLFELAAESWDGLIDEIAAGGLAPDAQVPDALRRELEPELAPDPARARELRGLRAAGPRAWWPGLSVAACWKGGSLGFYLTELEPWLGDLPIRDLGILASEAMVTIPVDDGPSGGVLLPESAFFEFVPEGAPTSEARPAWELEEGGSYRLLVTTHAGLYRYDLADIVRVDGRHRQMPMLSFLQRAGRTHSFTGEKLTELQVTQAIRAAADKSGVRLAGFTTVPVWGRPPRYEVRAELAAGAAGEKRQRLATGIDEEIRGVNVEYAAKRDSGRLGHTALALVAAGSFDRLRRECSARDAQYKQVHLSSDPLYGGQLEVVERIAG